MGLELLLLLLPLLIRAGLFVLKLSKGCIPPTLDVLQ